MMIIQRVFLAAVIPLCASLWLIGVISTDAAAAGPLPSHNEQTGAAGRTITVVGRGVARTAPDVAEVVVGVQFAAPTPKGAMEQANLVMADIRTALTALNIAEEDIQGAGFSLKPRLTGGNNPAGVPEAELAEGYIVSRKLRLTVHDISQLDTVLATAVDAGANIIDDIHFKVSVPAAAEAEARQLAIANAHDRADALAVLTGVSVGAVQAIRELATNISMNSVDERVSETTASPDPFDVVVQVQITYTIE